MGIDVEVADVGGLDDELRIDVIAGVAGVQYGDIEGRLEKVEDADVDRRFTPFDGDVGECFSLCREHLVRDEPYFVRREQRLESLAQPAVRRFLFF